MPQRRAAGYQTILVLQVRYHVRRSIDACNKKVFALRLLGRQIASNRRRVVDRKHRINFRICGQQVGHNSKTFITLALRILILGENLDTRIFLDDFKKSAHPVDHRSYRRPIDDAI
jgi:hypothetical protein